MSSLPIAGKPIQKLFSSKKSISGSGYTIGNETCCSVYDDTSHIMCKDVNRLNTLNLQILA